MIDLDRYSRLDSPVHRLEPRSRLVGFAALIGGFALVRDPVLLVPMLVIAAAAVLSSRLPLGFILRRLTAPMVLVTTVPAELDPTLRSAGVTALTLAHLPLALVEGVFTALVVLFLREVQPDLLHGWRR